MVLGRVENQGMGESNWAQNAFKRYFKISNPCFNEFSVSQCELVCKKWAASGDRDPGWSLHLCVAEQRGVTKNNFAGWEQRDGIKWCRRMNASC